MINRKITPNMIAQAEILLARSAFWTRGTAVTEDGRTVGVVTFNSSRKRIDANGNEITVTYLTRCDGAACSCTGFQMRQACSHAVACRKEAERAREAIHAPNFENESDVLTAWAF